MLKKLRTLNPFPLFAFIPLLSFLNQNHLRDSATIVLGFSKHSNCSQIAHKFNTTAAVTSKKKAIGLSGRVEELKGDEAMLFVYEEFQQATFWMKDTYIPLSIGFFNEQGSLFRVYEMKPESDPRNPKGRYPSGKPVKFVLEAAPGKISQNQLRQILCIEKKN